MSLEEVEEEEEDLPRVATGLRPLPAGFFLEERAALGGRRVLLLKGNSSLQVSSRLDKSVKSCASLQAGSAERQGTPGEDS